MPNQLQPPKEHRQTCTKWTSWKIMMDVEVNVYQSSKIYHCIVNICSPTCSHTSIKFIYCSSYCIILSHPWPLRTDPELFFRFHALSRHRAALLLGRAARGYWHVFFLRMGFLHVILTKPGSRKKCIFISSSFCCQIGMYPERWGRNNLWSKRWNSKQGGLIVLHDLLVSFGKHVQSDCGAFGFMFTVGIFSATFGLLVSNNHQLNGNRWPTKLQNQHCC